MFVPPLIPHLEVNMSTTEELWWLASLCTPENIVVNLSRCRRSPCSSAIAEPNAGLVSAIFSASTTIRAAAIKSTPPTSAMGYKGPISGVYAMYAHHPIATGFPVTKQFISLF